MADDDDKLVRVMERGFETLSDLIRETNGRLDDARRELGDEVRGTNARIDNLIQVSCGETRGLREDVDALRAGARRDCRSSR
jgi:hypothetical protein